MKTKMKEMEYNGSGKSELLYMEFFDDGTALAVVNTRGMHPCAYITFKGIEEVESYDDFYFKEENDDEYFDVHGGFTFLGTLNQLIFSDITWLGWDYAHSGDFVHHGKFIESAGCGIIHYDEEKKYTTQELVDEATEALSWIRKGKYEIYK